MDLNKVQLIGRVTQDIELKQTPNGQNVTSFSLATNRNYTDASGVRQDQTEFHSIVLWGKLAEIAGQYLTKGRQVYIEGRLQTRNWEAQDGTKRYKTEIVGENLIMLGNKSDNVSYEQGSSSENYSNETPAVKKTTPKVEEEISIE
ncbi:single-stranded DNA-binding protein, partial [Candidatus Gracilibacteria bacterium]|nr:single-stranded DNA-binding protein [Candidatus Gracilibacteria bacterium]